jgi:hypothetical protein
LLLSLARQLLESRKAHFDTLEKLHSRNKIGHNRLDVEEVRALLASICGRNTSLFIIIDAIDECAVAEERALVLSILMELSGHHARVLVTGRPNLGDVNDYLVGYSHIDNFASTQDIRTYVLDKMRGNATFMERIATVNTAEDQIVTNITTRASGM